jgi:hypothetical protein
MTSPIVGDQEFFSFLIVSGSFNVGCLSNIFLKIICARVPGNYIAARRRAPVANLTVMFLIQFS